MKNRTKKLLKAGKVAVGVQLRLGTAAIAEMFAYAGCDFIMVDGEHAPQSPVGVQAQFQAMGSSDVTPIARLSSNDPDMIRVYLDMGALGIFAPFINNAEDARIGADSLRYPPQGTRGYGPSRAAKFGFDENYAKEANDNVMYLANIENEKAVKNIDEILAIEGLDSFLIGPCDLSYSLGIPFEFANPKFKDAVKTILKAAENQKKPAGIGIYGDPFNPDVLKDFIDQGFQLILAGGDEWMLSEGLKRYAKVLNKIKEQSN